KSIKLFFNFRIDFFSLLICFTKLIYKFIHFCTKKYKERNTYNISDNSYNQYKNRWKVKNNGPYRNGDKYFYKWYHANEKDKSILKEYISHMNHLLLIKSTVLIETVIQLT